MVYGYVRREFRKSQHVCLCLLPSAVPISFSPLAYWQWDWEIRMQNTKATQNIHLANWLENIFPPSIPSFIPLTISPLVFVDVFPTPLFSQRRIGGNREEGKYTALGHVRIHRWRWWWLRGWCIRRASLEFLWIRGLPQDNNSRLEKKNLKKLNYW